MDQTFGIVLLAAGNSSRLGKPKQLLQFQGKSLLVNTLHQAKMVVNSSVLVVTGAYKELVEKEIDSISVPVVFHPDWENGMTFSIAAGLEALLLRDPNIPFCIFTVCDQPYISSEVFSELVAQQNITQKGIVASAYSDTLGIPVLFTSRYFEELLQKKGKEGAKKMLEIYKDDVAFIEFEKGAIDIDTIEDYIKLINQ